MHVLDILLQSSSATDGLKFFGMKLINTEDLISLLVRFSMNLIVVIAIVIGLYAKTS